MNFDQPNPNTILRGTVFAGRTDITSPEEKPTL